MRIFDMGVYSGQDGGVGFAYLVMKSGRQVDESRMAVVCASPGEEQIRGFTHQAATAE